MYDDVKRFLEITSYLLTSIPNLFVVNTPMRDLVKKQYRDALSRIPKKNFC